MRKTFWQIVREEVAIAVGRYGPLLAGAGATGLAGQTLAQEANHIQEPTRPQAVQVEKTPEQDTTHSLSLEWETTPSHSQFLRTVITEHKDGKSRNIVVGEGHTDPENHDYDFRLRRLGVSYPISIGPYRTSRFDIFGEHDGRDEDLDNWGLGINTWGELGDSGIQLGLVAEYSHNGRRVVVPYRNKMLRGAHNLLSESEQRLLDAGLDADELTKTRERLESTATLLGQKKDVDIIEDESTFLGGIILGRPFDLGSFTIEPIIGIYNQDGEWTGTVTSYSRFGKDRRTILASSFIFDENDRHDLYVVFGTHSAEMGKGFAGRVKGYTDFEGDWSVKGKMFLDGYVGNLFIIGPLNPSDGGDNDISLVDNPSDFADQWEYDFGGGHNNLGLCGGIVHTEGTTANPKTDLIYLEATMHPLYLAGLTTCPNESYIVQIFKNQHVGARWECKDMGDLGSSDQYRVRWGSFLQPTSQTTLGWHVDYGRDFDGNDYWAGFLVGSMPLYRE